MTVAIDSDTARDAAERELSKPIYPKPGFSALFWEWFTEKLSGLVNDSSEVPGGWFTITILLLLVVAAVVLAVRVAQRTMMTNRGAEPGMFGTAELSAAQHRATAEQFAATGNWAAAIRHRLRAVARHLEETGELQAVPSRTATELALGAAPLAPELAGKLRTSATIFNDVTYGEQPGTEPGYRAIAQLDQHLMSRRPGQQGIVAAAPDEWARIS
ncbi:MAG: DUF4129 domain-containing protein [Mycobacterium sp.]